MTLTNLQNLFHIQTVIIYMAIRCQKKLPTHRFKWMNNKELENWRDFSCILEVDLKYSKNLHTLHNDYPLAPENIKPPGSKVD